MRKGGGEEGVSKSEVDVVDALVGFGSEGMEDDDVQSAAAAVGQGVLILRAGCTSIKEGDATPESEVPQAIESP
jgi:hypothetical protein